jgi:Uma2 family endonuclease
MLKLIRSFPKTALCLEPKLCRPGHAVIHQSRIPTHNEPIKDPPDWLIEILSPDQSTTKLIVKIQDCLDEGTQLNWLIDSQEEEKVMILLPNQTLQLLSGESLLPVLNNISLKLTSSKF